MLWTSQQIEKVLFKHLLKTVPPEKVRMIAKEISGLGDEWEEVANLDQVIGANISVQCEDICSVGEAYKNGTQLRLFKKKS